jgi:hypothetical protein
MKSIESESLSTISFNSDIECRCPKCFLIPFINVFVKDHKLMMEISCINGHKYLSEFEEIYKKTKINLDKIKCYKCDTIISKYKRLSFYCTKCQIFLCSQHLNVHEVEKGTHNIVEVFNMDSFCSEHNSTILGYCEKHKKNYCINCLDNDELCTKKINKISFNDIEKYKNQIEKIENFFFKIDSLFLEFEKNVNNFIKFYKNFKNINKIKTNFLKELIKTYENKLKENNINFQIIKNIQNNLFENIYIEKSIENEINKIISETNNFQLKYKNETKIIKEENQINITGENNSGVVYISI